MKKLSLLLVLAMLLTSIAAPAMATESAIKESASGFYYIEANGEQAKLSAQNADLFIQADGLYFKDLNKNGALDVYEDYRQDVTARVEDLLSQMTLNEKTGILGFGGIAGNNGSTVTDMEGNTSSGTGDTSSIINTEHPAITATADEVNVTVGTTTYPSMAYQAQKMGISTYIAALTGTPKDQLELINALQVLHEESRLGIPAVFSGDRSYNTWGGMIDMPHYALGITHDEELLYKLVSEYAKESVAIGYHQVFHGYGNEIGSWYGDEVNYIAKMSVAETRAYEDNGFSAHSKHFIARGGRNAYVDAKSPADLIDSWMVGWKAVVDAGTSFIMTNNNEGITPGVQGYMDKETYKLLREGLGYEGVICLDWPLSPVSLLGQTGITADGVDISTLTLGERYVLILDAGVDMFSCGFLVAGTDTSQYTGSFDMVYYPDVLLAEIEAGKYTEEALDVHVARILKNKFDLGIFEDPFSDWEEAMQLIGTEAYIATNGEVIPMSNEEIDLYRRPEIVELEEEVMVKSSILFKNDGILPLAEGIKVYSDSNNGNIRTADAAAFGAKATIVETMDEADVVVYHATSFDENYDYMVEDADLAGKPIVLIVEGTSSVEPGLTQIMDCNAVLMQTYSNTPDHGSSIGSFYRYVTPSVTADMLFGVKSPAGSTVFEIAYNEGDLDLSWGELQHDIGVDTATRLWMAGMVRENPNMVMYNNLGNVLCTTNYGMTYGEEADIVLDTFVVPQVMQVSEVESNGSISTETSIVNASPKAGEAFEINFLATNKGADGHVTAQVLDNGELIAEKFIALDAGQFRVITIEIALDAGEHVISVGDMSATIVVE